jgi:hypothetical protein
VSKRVVPLRWPGEDFGKLTWSFLIRAISYYGGVFNNYMHVEHGVSSEAKSGDYLMGVLNEPLVRHHDWSAACFKLVTAIVRSSSDIGLIRLYT